MCADYLNRNAEPSAIYHIFSTRPSVPRYWRMESSYSFFFSTQCVFFCPLNQREREPGDAIHKIRENRGFSRKSNRAPFWGNPCLTHKIFFTSSTHHFASCETTSIFHCCWSPYGFWRYIILIRLARSTQTNHQSSFLDPDGKYIKECIRQPHTNFASFLPTWIIRLPQYKLNTKVYTDAV